ncbi:unnamed protein product, partial [Amoebophrya sp. A120]
REAAFPIGSRSCLIFCHIWVLLMLWRRRKCGGSGCDFFSLAVSVLIFPFPTLL